LLTVRISRFANRPKKGFRRFRQGAAGAQQYSCRPAHFCPLPKDRKQRERGLIYFGITCCVYLAVDCVDCTPISNNAKRTQNNQRRSIIGAG
jgi:hypothetical protein